MGQRVYHARFFRPRYGWRESERCRRWRFNDWRYHDIYKSSLSYLLSYLKLSIGGVSFFSGRYGFACDNVFNFEVVLASGATVNANATSNPTLYRALKGGSNNLGVVTRFDVRLFQQGSFWGGSFAQAITEKQDVINFISDFTHSTTYDPYAALITNFVWDAGLKLILSDVEYTKPTPYPPAFAPLFALPALANSIKRPYNGRKEQPLRHHDIHQQR
jgi:hypothetical protein